MSASRSDVEAEVFANQLRQRADEAYRFATGGPAPGYQAGENVAAYHVRLVSGLIPYGRHQKMTVDSLAQTARAGALGIIAEQVFEDAITYGKRPSGPLREVPTPDDAGRTIRRFFGDPSGCWDQFKLPVRRVAQFFCAGGRP
jgi:hypothetical protein